MVHTERPSQHTISHSGDDFTGQITQPTEQCHSTDGQWLVNLVNSQSHQTQLTKGK